MENLTNHIVQQQTPTGQQQFVVPMQNAKFVVNAVNVNHTNNMAVNHTVSAVAHQVNHNINHVVNNQTANMVKANATIQGNSGDIGPLISTSRISELAREVDPTLQLDEEVEECLQGLVENFVEKVLNGACTLAKHRHVPTVEVKDVQLFLEKNFDMWIPGFGTDELRPYKRATTTEAHKQRLSLIRKTVKKY